MNIIVIVGGEVKEERKVGLVKTFEAFCLVSAYERR